MRWIAVLFIVLFLASAAMAQSRETSTSSSSSRSPLDARVDAAAARPLLSVTARPETLPEITTEYHATREEKNEAERDFRTAREVLINASNAQRAEALNAFTHARSRLMVSILNSLIAVYHRVDYITLNMETAALRLDSFYQTRVARGGTTISDYAPRYAYLLSELENIKATNAHAVESLENARTSVNMSQALSQAQEALRESVAQLQNYLSLYRALAREVVQS